MRRTIPGLSVAATTMLLTTGSVFAGEIDPNLQDVMDQAARGEILSSLVYMDNQMSAAEMTAQLDAMKASRRVRHQLVIETLQDLAAGTQAELLDYLDARVALGGVESYRSYWIGNIVRVDATAQELEAIAQFDAVDMVYLNYGIELVEPTEMGPVEKETGEVGLGGPENGVVAVRAPEAWAEGYDGTGVLVSIQDTGTDGNHPSLASRWQGLDPAYAANPEWAFFDPWLEQHDFPYDGGSHGTHVMGSVLGGGPGDQVGVAPGATWITAASIDRGGGISGTVADALESFEWLADPDGNPGTIFDVPATNSNSWGLTTGHGYPPCEETFWGPIDNLEAAGTLVLFAAGNEGFSGLRRPGDRATDEYRTFSVAAVDGNTGGYPIASFSSRGPTNCTPSGQPAIKPDISAPGVNVRSSVPGGGYSNFSGTSMATPHVNGVVALIIQACPNLTIEEIKQIVFDTSSDLGPNGEDNDYGYGMIDAYEAVLMAEAMCGPSPPRAFDAYHETAVNTPTSFDLLSADHDEDPGGPLTTRILSLPANATLTDVGNGHEISGGDLPYDLFDHGNTVMFTPGGGFYGETAFQFSADDGGTPPDGGEGDAATVTVLVKFPAPQITSDVLPNGYLTYEYGPVQVEVDGGQPELTYTLISNEYVEADLGSSMFQAVGTAQNWHADDNSWQVNIPFPFPFYGNDYNSVYATSNGFLNFDGPSSDWSNSSSEMINATRICPLWDDLRTDQGGDIYVDTSVPGQLTVRWDTVTYSGGNQCNHSCTLYADGRIRFHYGNGNSGLTPTIGVSSGDGSNYLFSQYDGANNLGNANSVESYPPSGLPEGLTLDSDGVITGTPLETGSFDPRVRVVDALGRTDQRQLSLDILEGTPPCPEDLNNNGSVDVDDLLTLLANWGTDGTGSDIAAPNNIVDVNDLLGLLAAWGDC